MKKNNIAQVLNRFFLLIALLLPGCARKTQIDTQKVYINPASIARITSQATDSIPPITIWVHGTLIFRKPSYYQVFNNQSSLIAATELPHDHHFHLLAKTISDHDPEHFPFEEFYIFGWSGRLQNKERKDAAEKLYHEIIALIETYQKKYGYSPIIRIITHSHGGNVVLYMAKLKNIPEPIQINSLILLACPVQEKTMYLIGDPMFQRVYSLCSSRDMIQILAPQFRHSRTANQAIKRKYRYRILPFSERLFPNYENVTQTKIRINGHSISHTYFSTKKFIAFLPTILQKLDAWHDESNANNRQSNQKLLCVYQKN